MVSYPTEAPRDSGHDRFIASLNRDLCTRMFETHAHDLHRAAERYLDGVLDPDALVTLVLETLKALNYYSPGGVLYRVVDAYKRARGSVPKSASPYTDEAFDVALERLIEAVARDEGEDAAPEPEPTEPGAAGAGESECATPQSDSGTPFANSNSSSKGECRNEIEE